MNGLRERLRIATSDAHTRVEDAPFHRALREGVLPREAALSFLHCLAIIHAALERSLSLAADARVRKIWEGVIPKLPLLLADLRAASDVGDVGGPAIQAALAHVSRIVTDSGVSPAGLLGHLYVLEGSQNGGVVLRSLYAKAMGLEPSKLAYFGCYGGDTRSTWAGFVERLDSIAIEEREAGEIERAAVSAFEGMGKIVESLFPVVEESLDFQASAVNPEAGSHAIPSDPIELAIAVRSGTRARERFPYLEARFGERGRRFTTSDSCWLLTLFPRERELAERSLVWLRKVLSSRGIPTLILEAHLEELAAELVAVYPGRAAEAARMREIIAALASRRESQVPSAKVTALALEWEPKLARLRTTPAGPVVPLLASAVADERDGVPGAFEATRSWFENADGFSAEWGLAIGEICAKLGDGGREP